MPLLFTYKTVGPASFPLKQADNNNQTTARMGMPFKPDTMTQGSDFASGRLAYIENAGTNRKANLNTISYSTTTTYTNRPIKVGINNSTLTAQIGAGKKKNYNVSASERIYLKKINAIGKSSTNTLPTETMSFSGVDQTSVKNALSRCRGGGTVSPKKKGAH